jgi:hypothetical protein
MTTFKDYLLSESVTVVTDTYKFSHSKEPRGHGNWLFTRDGIQNSLDFEKHKKNEDWFEHNGTFAQASKAAKAWARSKGKSYVHVAP